MRKVIGNIKSVFNVEYVNKQIVFTLCNKYNQPLKNTPSVSVPLKITVTTNENSNFEVELYEINTLNINIHYSMKLEDKDEFYSTKLYIPSGDSEIDFKNCITPQADLSSFYYLNENGKYIFDSETIILIDKFFVYQNCFTTGKEDELFCEFVKYADGLIESKDMEALDELMGSIIEILSPTYSAVESVVSNDIHKAKDLIEALGDLDDMNKDTQQMMIDNQLLLKKVVEDAKEQSLIFG